jgi:glutamate synthase (NADPH/NADH)
VVLSQRFIDNGQGGVAGVETVNVEWKQDEDGRHSMVKVEGSEQVFEADLVFLAMGFLGPETVRARPGRLSALRVSHSKSLLYGAFVWARRPLHL